LRLAIISDIHGNLVALESVLPKIKDADRVICLGDVAATGPLPRETIALIRKARWPCVMGNTDERLASSTPEDFKRSGMPENERLRLVALDEWTMTKVSSSDRRFLAGFKPTIELHDGRNSILCYHGSPRSNTEQILSTTPDSDLAKILTAKGVDVFAGGHTHAQMIRKFGNSIIINPGSIGLPFVFNEAGRAWNPTWAEYAMVTLTRDDMKVELRRSRYSLAALKTAVHSSGMPDPDWWLNDWV
jgi:putative phosphoesterase